MISGKKKSPGSRRWDKRRTPARLRAKQAAADAARARRDSNRLGAWHACPRRRCRRAESCGGEPLQCRARREAAIARHRKATPPAATVAAATAPPPPPPPPWPAAPVMSAAEAAAAIKASIAAESRRAFNRNDLEALRRAGLI